MSTISVKELVRRYEAAHDDGSINEQEVDRCHQRIADLIAKNAALERRIEVMNEEAKKNNQNGETSEGRRQPLASHRTLNQTAAKNSDLCETQTDAAASSFTARLLRRIEELDHALMKSNTRAKEADKRREEAEAKFRALQGKLSETDRLSMAHNQALGVMPPLSSSGWKEKAETASAIVEELQHDIARLNREIAALKADKAMLESIDERQTENLAEWQRAAELAEKDACDAQRLLANTRKEVRKLTERIDNIGTAKLEAELRADTASQNLDEAMQEHDAVLKKLMHCKHDLDTVQTEKRILDTKLSEAKSENRKMKQELEHFKMMHERRVPVPPGANATTTHNVPRSRNATPPATPPPEPSSSSIAKPHHQQHQTKREDPHSRPGDAKPQPIAVVVEEQPTVTPSAAAAAPAVQHRSASVKKTQFQAQSTSVPVASRAGAKSAEKLQAQKPSEPLSRKPSVGNAPTAAPQRIKRLESSKLRPSQREALKEQQQVVTEKRNLAASRTRLAGVPQSLAELRLGHGSSA